MPFVGCGPRSARTSRWKRRLCFPAVHGLRPDLIEELTQLSLDHSRLGDDLARLERVVYKVGDWGWGDDIIDPRETRSVVCRGIEMCWNRVVERSAASCPCSP